MGRYKTIITENNKIASNHILHGKKVLPGVVYLQFCISILKSEFIDVCKVEFEDVLFFTPLNLSSRRELEIRIDKENENWVVIGKSRDASSPEAVKHFECKIKERDTVFESEKVDIDKMVKSAKSIRNIDDAYEYVREAGIEHKSYMKPKGEVYGFDDAILGHIFFKDSVETSDETVKKAAVFDSSTVLPYLFIENEIQNAKRDKAFIPLCISKFKVWKDIPTEVYIYVKKKDVFLADNEDVCYASWKIFDINGEIVAEFSRLSSKKIRIEGYATSDSNKVIDTDENLGMNALEGKDVAYDYCDDLEDFVRRFIENKIGEYIKLDSGNEKYDLGFFDLGLSSKHMVEIVRSLEKDMNCRLYPTILFEYSTMREFCKYLLEEYRDCLQILKSGESVSGQSIYNEPHLIINESQRLLYEFVWDRREVQSNTKCSYDKMIVVLNEQELSLSFKNDSSIVIVSADDKYARYASNRFSVNPFSVNDFENVFREVANKDERFVIVDLLDYVILKQLRKENCEHNVYYHNVAMLQAIKASGLVGQIEKLLIVAYHDSVSNIYTHALAGMYRCYLREAGEKNIAIITMSDCDNEEEIKRVIYRELYLPEYMIEEIIYNNSGRFVKSIKKQKKASNNNFIEKGVYIITGGFGKAIKCFIESVVKNSDSKFILLGRSGLNAEKKKWLESVNQYKALVEYECMDICKADDANKVLRQITAREKEIMGIIHAAGVIEDELIESKKIGLENLEKVIECKIVGWNNVVDALENIHVKFAIFFSSISAIFGNVGQSNYAYANAYLDNYSVGVNKLKCDGIVSVNWPLLNCGGMDEFIDTEYILETTGMNLLKSEFMVNFLQTCEKRDSQVMYIDGETKRIEQEIEKMYPISNDKFCEKLNRDNVEKIEYEDNIDIAIIGIDAKFPMADSLEEFWDNLTEGKDCITSIPQDRWMQSDVDAILGDSSLDVCKYGGFLNDIDMFDTKLFNITPIEAKNMDLQERLFISSVWRTVEDAGYSKTELNNKRIGVFAGTMWGHYQLGETLIDGKVTVASSIYASIANRVSSYFNWHGPSMTLDTMCSSVMTAINLACESIKNGGSEMAIVGGVNLSLHPKKYIVLAQNNFTASDGKCRSFGEGGQGYVPGEGVGVFLLKKLDKAIDDGDNIYGVIKACEINHGGKTSGYSVPNSRMQADVIEKALLSAKVSVNDISYIEAHGTGTALGDPIEINALQNVFAKHTNKLQFCPIGSVKSNIGHLEAASCVASIAKVLLQFKYKKLVPSIHSEIINKNIHFEDTAFYCQHEYEEWVSKKPRLAGVNAFGAGGSNGHLILQEYVENRTSGNAKQDVLVFLYSAQSQDVLEKILENNLNFLKKNKSQFVVKGQIFNAEYAELETIVRKELCPEYLGDSENLAMRDLSIDMYLIHKLSVSLKHMGYMLPDSTHILMQEYLSDLIKLVAKCNGIKKYVEDDTQTDERLLGKEWEFIVRYAYTLATGREHMSHRAAIIAAGLDDLVNKIMGYLNDGKKQGVYVSSKDIYNSGVLGIFDMEEGKRLVNSMLLKRNYEKVVQLWCAGLQIKWSDMFPDSKIIKLSIPTYPFSGDVIQRAKFNYRKDKELLAKEEVSHYGLELQIYQQKWSNKHLSSKSNLPENVLVITNKKTGYDRYFDNVAEISKFGKADNLNVSDLLAQGKGFDTIIIHWSDEESGIYRTLENIYGLVKEILEKRIKCRILCVCKYSETNETVILRQAISGFAKTLYLENQDIQIKVLTITDTYLINKKTSLEQVVVDELTEEEICFEVSYDDERKVSEYQDLEFRGKQNELGETCNCCYVIAGGCGRIGKMTADYLLKNSIIKIVLLGRKQVSFNNLCKLFGKNADRVIYYSLDISDIKQVETVYKKIKEFGLEVRGIINSAGVFRNSLIQNKHMEDVETVLSSKVLGTLNLHCTFIDEPLSVFCLYSSIAGEFGKVGQADYAYANSFLNHFVEYRENERKQNKCYGNTVCISWPFWKNGGMQIDEYEVEQLMDQYGIAPLPDEEGIYALENLISSPSGNYLVLYGQKEKMTSIIMKQVEKRDKSDKVFLTNQTDFKAMTESWLMDVFCQLFEFNPNDIDVQTEFGSLGIDSVGFNRLQTKMEKYLGIMKKTLMYETKNISELAAYLIEAKKDMLGEIFHVENPANKEAIVPRDKNVIFNMPISCDLENRGFNEEIAIIGMSGRFPGAENCAELWNNISLGVDSVGEIPKERWNIDFFNNGDYENLESGKSYCRWGGFLEDVSSFDYQFFRMSPKEAQTTDPQERLFLEVAYEIMEDAGYNTERLHRYRDDNGSAEIGVFVSGASNTYNLIGLEEWGKGNYIVPNALPWSISNRISYCMNFSGPSFTVDAACAGGMVSLHQAITALHNGECKMALAGGVNLYLHPYKYVSLSQVKMLSKTGKCYAFSDKADGFVPGESVAGVLLKPLSQARKDNDYIYGVIKASGINHDGASNGYMAPNSLAQTALIKRVINEAGIDARQISYVEAHGTGTPVGDPIEVEALSNAFRNTTLDKQYCSLGSVKTNIGHSEGAAAIVGLIKVLLQMKHKKIAPSLYADAPSEAIDFKSTPFVLQDKIAEWKRMTIDGKKVPRIASISSFGAGGTNGHLIVEENEFVDTVEESEYDDDAQYLFPISAKTAPQLTIIIKDLLKYLDDGYDDIKINNLAYTMQISKCSFEHKVIFIANSKQQLVDLFKAYILKPNFVNENIFSNVIRTTTCYADLSRLKTEKSYENCRKIAAYWLQGLVVNWEELYSRSLNLYHLPHYPFLKKRCWVETVADKNLLEKSVRDSQGNSGKSNDMDVISDYIENDEIDLEKVQNALSKIL